MDAETVELVRVPLEKAFLEQLRRDGFRAWERDDATRHRELQARSLRLNKVLAPKATAAVETAAARLCVEEEVLLYQGAAPRPNACYVSANPIAIELLGNCEGTFDAEGLVAFMGHELGHHLAHAHPLHEVARKAARIITQGRVYALASELTADRFGLLACRDLNVALRLEMLFVAGDAGLALDTDAYLADVRTMVDGMLTSLDVAVGTTHPEHAIRTYASALFYESDLYRTLTSTGPSLRSIEEVNGTLTKLLGANAFTSSGCIADPEVEPSPLMATVGVDGDEEAMRKASQPITLEELAADILTDGVARKLAAGARRVRSALTMDDPVRDDAPSAPKSDLQARFEEMVRAKRKGP